ncbi:MAG: mevalonate kinase [Chloroflexi bacterium]|nr:mevalonate kinase [Chloroflexota bacterium]
MSATASAPGKIILFGEHAVVYGRPAIAVPVLQVASRVTVEEAESGVHVVSSRGSRTLLPGDLNGDDPIAAVLRHTLSAIQYPGFPNITITIDSTIPVAGGLGSGAAVSTAVARAMALHLGRTLDAATVSALVYEVEKIHHGTPSGIDNTVIAFGRPVYFMRGRPIEMLIVPRPFTLVVADTGIASLTKIAVGDVRRSWEAGRERFEALFDRCGDVARRARALIEGGRPEMLGPLMNENHAALREMGVSCAELDTLVGAAITGGALGAKLSGGGRGGNMIALVKSGTEAAMAEALLRAGAKRTIVTEVGGSFQV